MIWYAITTTPQHERTACGLLRRAGLQTYIPERRAKVRRHRRSNGGAAIMVPAISGIAFVAAPRPLSESVETWRRIIDTRHVFDLVRMGGEPWPIPWPQIERMARHNGEADKLARHSVGDQVRMVAGAFGGLDAEVTGIDGNRLRLLLDMLGAQREIEASVDDVALLVGEVGLRSG